MAQWNAIPVWRRRVPRALAIAVVVSLALPLAAQVQERVDHDAVYQIKDEGFRRSKVMEIASYLTDVHGPRLSGSPIYTKGAEWAMQQFSEWGFTMKTMPHRREMLAAEDIADYLVAIASRSPLKILALRMVLIWKRIYYFTRYSLS